MTSFFAHGYLCGQCCTEQLLSAARDAILKFRASLTCDSGAHTCDGEAEMILTTAAHVRGTPLPFPCSYSSDLLGTVASESPESTEANLACEDLCSKRLKVDYTCHIIYYAIGHPVIRRSMDSTSQGKTMVHFFFKAC